MKPQHLAASFTLMLCCLALLPKSAAAGRFDSGSRFPTIAQDFSGAEGGDATNDSPSVAPSPRRAATNPASALLPLRESEQLRLDLVNCWGWLDCFLARRILPAADLIDGRSLYFRNLNESSVTVVEALAVAQGELTRFQLNEKALQFPQSNPAIRSNRIGSLAITLDRSEMPPDRYNGSIYLTLKAEQEQELKLPLSINVRSGPLLPLLVLFLGIVVGRILKYQQERGEPQADQLADVYALEADIKAAALAEVDEKRLLGMVKGIRKLVFREQLDEVPEQIDVIRARLYGLDQLQDIEQRLATEGFQSSLAMEARALVMKARRHVLQKEDAEAKQSLEQVQALLNEAGRQDPQGDQVLSRSIERATTAADFAQEYAQPSKATRRSRQVSNARRSLIWIAGVSEEVRAEANLWLMRPLLSLTLLVSLSAIGLGSLYVENGKSFGAKPFSDYFSLILWGLSADIASRSLSSLQGPMKPLGAGGTGNSGGQVPAPAQSARAQGRGAIA